MRWRWNLPACAAAFFSAVIIASCLVLVVEPIRAAEAVTESAAGKPGVLAEGDYLYLPDDAGAPAGLTDNDDSRFSSLRVSFLKYVAVPGVFNAEQAYFFSILKAVSKDGPADDKDTILLKLRI